MKAWNSQICLQALNQMYNMAEILSSRGRKEMRTLCTFFLKARGNHYRVLSSKSTQWGLGEGTLVTMWRLAAWRGAELEEGVPFR